MNDDIYNTKIVDHLVRTRLECFYELAFEKLSGGEPYMESWYISLLCEYLQAFSKGQIKRLNINIPPRFGKSALCNVAFSTWFLGLNPEKRIISISYSADLSKELHSYSRAITNSSWFKRAFPKFNIDVNFKLDKTDQNETKNTQSVYATSLGGYRVATSSEASITGKGANILIFDDLMDPKQALSQADTDRILQWTRSTAFSRFNNRSEGQMLNIQQRLGEKDFAGTFVDDNWESVIIPIQARETKLYSFGSFKKTYEEGEFLEARRYAQKELEEDKFLMGSKSLEAQFFQEPYPQDGDIFKKEYFKYYIHLPKCGYYAIYSDTAMKEGRHNDNSVFMCWGLLTKNGRKYAYLVDCQVGKWSAPILKQKAISFWDKWKNNDAKVPLIKFAIEDKASGTGLIQDLQYQSNIPVVKLIPEKDKVARANDILPRLESGQVLFDQNASYLADLEKELLCFSNKKGKNKKDQVDTLTYAVKDLLFDPIDDKNRPLDYSGLVRESQTLSNFNRLFA